MVSPSQKRHAAQGVVAAGLCSRRQACRYLGLARSSCAYRPRPPTDRRVRTEAAIVALSRRYPRYGYRRIHALVERQGHRCARRTVQRVRRQEGLRVAGPSRRPKCPPRLEAKIGSEGVNDLFRLDLGLWPRQLTPCFRLEPFRASRRPLKGICACAKITPRGLCVMR